MSLHEKIYKVSAVSTTRMLPPLENYKNPPKTIFVKNNSIADPAEVQLLVSPNGEDWAEENSFQVIMPGKTIFLIQGLVAKYFTVAYRCPGGNAKLTIWLDYVTREPHLINANNVCMKCRACWFKKALSLYSCTYNCYCHN